MWSARQLWLWAHSTDRPDRRGRLTLWAYRVIVATCLAAVTGALVIEWGYGPSWAGGIVGRTPRGIPLLGAVLVLVLTAEWVVLTVELPMLVDPSPVPTSLQPWLRVLVGVLLALLVGKLVLLHRFADALRSRQRSNGLLLGHLLPFQASNLDDLSTAILSSPLDFSGQLVQLVGRWGEGKSFLLRHLPAYLALRTRSSKPGTAAPGTTEAVVVLVDVWKHEAEPDLHLAILEELLSNCYYLLRFGWLRCPVSVLVGRYLRDATMKFALRPKVGPEVELPLRLPRLVWQPAFERLVHHQLRRGRRTVIVLDEIDRATPRMAQVAITLARRSLDLAGVTVVLSYEANLMQNKAFNPLLLGDVDRLPDLGSTMDAVIMAEAHQRALRSTPAGQSPGSLWPPSDLTRLPESLARWYESQDHVDRRRVQARISEKYLGTRPVEMHPVAGGDVAKMPFALPALTFYARKLTGDPDEGEREKYEQATLDTWTRWRRRRSGDEVPPLRFLEASMLKKLRKLTEQQFTEQGEDVVPTPQFWAAVVIALYESAASEWPLS